MAILSANNYPPSTYYDWYGLCGGFDINNDSFFLTVQDAKETKDPYNNSSSASFNNISNYVNIYDGSTHTILFGWKANGIALTGVSQLIHRSGVLTIDNFAFSPNSTNSSSGKSTSLSFIYNDTNNGTNWAFGGFYPNADSATSKTNTYQANKNFNGIIEKIVIWDKMLTGATTLSTFGSVNQTITGAWKAAIDDENAFSGGILKSMSSNVIAYYDLKRDAVGSLTARDYAGTSLSGFQISPTTGHTLNIFGGSISGISSYLLYDVNNNNPSLTFPNGIIQFVDENNLTRNVGTIFYDLGMVVLDNEYVAGSNSGFPILSRLSLSSMGWNTPTGFNVNYISFDKDQKAQRMIITARANSGEFNSTQNITGIIQQTGEQLLKQNQGTYVTSVGLYNSLGDLLAVAKLNEPIRKDEDHSVTVNVNIDF